MLKPCCSLPWRLAVLAALPLVDNDACLCLQARRLPLLACSAGGSRPSVSLPFVSALGWSSLHGLVGAEPRRWRRFSGRRGRRCRMAARHQAGRARRRSAAGPPPAAVQGRRRRWRRRSGVGGWRGPPRPGRRSNWSGKSPTLGFRPGCGRWTPRRLRRSRPRPKPRITTGRTAAGSNFRAGRGRDQRRGHGRGRRRVERPMPSRRRRVQMGR